VRGRQRAQHVGEDAAAQGEGKDALHAPGAPRATRRRRTPW
jgi:hypothetical protein